MRSLLASLLLLSATTALADDKTADAEAKKWQGTWKVVSIEHHGEQTPPEKLKPIKLTVEGANYHFENGDFSERGSYDFYPEETPRALNVVVGEGPDKGKVYLVIYKIDADQLTICLETDNKHRPKEFTAKKGSSYVLEKWQRLKE